MPNPNAEALLAAGIIFGAALVGGGLGLLSRLVS